MTQTPDPSDVAARRPGGRVAPRPGRLACAALMVLWLTALLVGAVAAAGEAPPPPQEAPPKAPPDADPGSQPEAAPKPEPKPQPEPETDPEAEATPKAEPEDEPGAEAREKDEPEAEDRPRPNPGEPLVLNFKDASLHAVLEYLSEAAGLIIVEEAEVEGRVTVMSLQPISTDEAIALLDTVLKEEGYAAIRSGRTLKIVSLARAAKENIPTFSGGDPDQIPMADRLVTQIIPVRFAEATKLKTDLAPLLSSTATLSTNAASNTLVLVDTQANIRRMAEIIQALDSQISGVAEVKVFQLEYANATNAARLITELFKAEEQRGADSARRMFPFFGRGGRDDRDRSRDEDAGREQKVIAAADDRTNTLVISAPPDLLEVIEGIIEELDSNPSEEEAFFIYPLKNANAKNLETVLNQAFSEVTPTSGTTRTTPSTQGRGGVSQFGRSGTSQRVAASAGDLVGQVYVVADEDTNSLIVRAASKHVDRITELLVELDRATPQVLIKVLIAEVTHEDEIDLGSEFSILNLQFGVNVEGRGDLGGVDEQAGGLITATMTGGLAASFNALQREGRLNVLSRPYILASDNQEASITVGQEVPFITNSRTTETGQTINTIEYEDIGIILNVTPQINPQGLVIMKVAPEISHLLTDTTVPISETVNAAVYAKRSAQTQVAIRDGQTIVIGGLMEDRLTDSVRKVPVLGDIPLLGALFRRTQKTKVKTELLIFLTPHVARDPDDLGPMSEDEMAGSKTIRQAPQGQAFEEHLEGLQRGAAPAPRPQEEEREGQP